MAKPDFDLYASLHARFNEGKRLNSDLTWDQFRGIAVADLGRIIEEHPGLTDQPDFKTKRAEIAKVLNI